ncbi:hypothetical protein DPEC_G00087100 [Dallia pectoralis]|uniref:Uncharacterized protein n=1 Tax=Dallia pectoralis TaxID=75939 RepID=A0ACC2H0S8_DALPE|nr:hypothetical protein DPEC_G00087100 [Dallia pectoralis]
MDLCSNPLHSDPLLKYNKDEALVAIGHVLIVRCRSILVKTCNDDDLFAIIIRKGVISGARNQVHYTPCPSPSEEDDDNVSAASDTRSLTSTELSCSFLSSGSEETLIDQEVPPVCTPGALVMSSQTLQCVIAFIRCHMMSSVSPTGKRPKNTAWYSKEVFTEVQLALPSSGISVLLDVEDSAAFSGEDAVKAIVKTAVKRVSLEQAELNAAGHCSILSTWWLGFMIAKVIQTHAEEWSSHSDNESTWSVDSWTTIYSSDSDLSLTEELLNGKEALEKDADRLPVPQVETSPDSHQWWMAFSTDGQDSTSTQISLDKAVGEDKRSVKVTLKKCQPLKKTNKVAPFVTAGPVAAEIPKKKRVS